VPDSLKEVMSSYDRVIFADVCKEGQNPFAGMVVKLRKEGLLPKTWNCVTAPKTYNPLGSVVTFLNVEDVTAAILGK